MSNLSLVFYTKDNCVQCGAVARRLKALGLIDTEGNGLRLKPAPLEGGIPLTVINVSEAPEHAKALRDRGCVATPVVDVLGADGEIIETIEGFDVNKLEEVAARFREESNGTQE